jgi:hypothetical protein
MTSATSKALFHQAWKIIETKGPELAKTINTTDAAKISVEVVNKVMTIIRATPEIISKIEPKKVKDFCHKLIYIHTKPNPVVKKIILDSIAAFARPWIRSRI